VGTLNPIYSFTHSVLGLGAASDVNKATTPKAKAKSQGQN